MESYLIFMAGAVTGVLLGIGLMCFLLWIMGGPTQ